MKKIPTQEQIDRNMEYIDDVLDSAGDGCTIHPNGGCKMSCFKNSSGYLDYSGSEDLDWSQCTLTVWQLLYAAGIEDDDNYLEG